MRESLTYETGLREECGVFGMFDLEGGDVARDMYYGLSALQHRGQEAAGIAVNKNGVIHCHKDVGLVSAVFNQDILDNMPGSMAIGHVRSSTTGDTRRENAQPISITHVKGNLAVAHNASLSVGPGSPRPPSARSSWTAAFSAPRTTPRFWYTPLLRNASSAALSKKPL